MTTEFLWVNLESCHFKGRSRWVDKMDFREIGIDGANLIWLVQDRFWWQAFVNTIINLRVP